ncbi:hypothetical protein CONLIGDRAFT_699229 [Coniochaeta ligniaria NRRL 30616]|uniref:C2H2-type domain-containing protein n=1 Tax=Coniochaeta ligniaria NRRL 30616 TaxID=1408157 RepID=A0A1J7IXM0_9PEZI|nr:hypothetical protein CONLIGDRAFT_699229 [Coniochaeta ligniaria NRRL 30616]
MSLIRGTAHLLSVPAEIRYLIYDWLLLEESQVTRTCSSKKTGNKCWCGLFFCCRQTYNELRHLLGRRTVQVSTRPDADSLFANVPCFQTLNAVEPNRVHFDINPLQYMDTTPGVYLAIVAICLCLRRDAKLSRLDITFDGTLPRRKAPLYIDEVDLERAPLNMIMLLYPFKLLAGRVENVKISIIGGPRNDPWQNYRFLTEFVSQVAIQMETRDAVDSESLILVERFKHGLKNGLLWQRSTCRIMAAVGFYPARVLRSPPDGQIPDSLPENCTVCGNAFTSRNQLFRHLRLFHYGPAMGTQEVKEISRRAKRLKMGGID